MSLIEVNNLKKTYGENETETIALEDVSFNINSGEFVSIMGPSGSGKSTLLHILSFLESETSGEYLFEGKSFKEYSEEQIAHLRNQKIGFVFQAFNLLPRTSVLENVKLPLIYSSIPEDKWDEVAKKAVESVGLTHRLDHEPSELSGGEKQRVAIARALVNNPEIIFADEPTGNLDSKSGKIIMEILQRLNKENGHTVLLITHETTTAEHAKRIITIRDGKVESDKPVENRRFAETEFSK